MNYPPERNTMSIEKIRTLSNALKDREDINLGGIVRLEANEFAELTYTTCGENSMLRMALVHSGEWDNIESLNHFPDMWYHVPTLNEKRLSIRKPVREAGRASLDKANVNEKSLIPWNQISEAVVPREQMMDLGIRAHLPVLRKYIQDTREPISIDTLSTMLYILNLRYLPNSGFTMISTDQLQWLTGFNLRKIQRSIKALSKSGLWGVIPVHGNDMARYYPLFVDSSNDKFSGLIKD